MSTAVLVIENGPSRGEQFSIEAPGVRLGRGADNHVVLEDDAITEHHARIDVRRDRYRLLDLGSLNGTFVNEARVQMQELHDGDRVQIGRVRLRFRVGKTGPALTTEPGVDTADAAAILRRFRTTTPAPRDPRSLAAAHSHLRTILEMSEQMAMFYDVEEVLQHGVDMCVQSLAPDRVVLLMRDGANGELQPRITQSDSGPPQISQSILHQVVQDQQAVRVLDAMADERFAGKESVVREGIRSVLCVPVRGEAGVVGACYLDRVHSDEPFTIEQLQLATLMANVLGQRLDHIRLYQETLEVATLKVLNDEMAATNAKLRELEQFKSDMVNMLVHDMKGSVATTMMSLDVIGLDADGGLTEQARQYVGIAKRNQRKLNEMIMNLLDLDRLEEGRLIPEIEQFDTHDFLRRVLETLGPYARGAKMSLKVKAQANLTCWSDPALLERILLNLVMNAINHSDPETTITIQTGAAGADQFTMAVGDEGEGIPPEFHDRIFEKFVQADVRELGLKSDVGLGLAFCRMAAQALGGDISVASEVGKGSIFTVTVPNVRPT